LTIYFLLWAFQQSSSLNFNLLSVLAISYSDIFFWITDSFLWTLSMFFETSYSYQLFVRDFLDYLDYLIYCNTLVFRFLVNSLFDGVGSKYYFSELRLLLPLCLQIVPVTWLFIWLIDEQLGSFSLSLSYFRTLSHSFDKISLCFPFIFFWIQLSLIFSTKLSSFFLNHPEYHRELPSVPRFSVFASFCNIRHLSNICLSHWSTLSQLDWILCHIQYNVFCFLE